MSLTRRQNGALRIKSSVLFWNFLISLRASVPGLYLRRFLSAKECFGASRSVDSGEMKCAFKDSDHVCRATLEAHLASRPHQ